MGFVGMSFVERIKPGAFDGALKDSDVRALKNHDPNLLLGRETAGTLELSANSRGLTEPSAKQSFMDAANSTADRSFLNKFSAKHISLSCFPFPPTILAGIFDKPIFLLASARL